MYIHFVVRSPRFYLPLLFLPLLFLLLIFFEPRREEEEDDGSEYTAWLMLVFPSEVASSTLPSDTKTRSVQRSPSPMVPHVAPPCA